MRDNFIKMAEAVMLGFGFGIGMVIVYVLCKGVGLIDTLVHAI